MTIAIKFENVSKQYRLGQVGTGALSHDIHRAWAKLRGKPDPFAKVGVENKREVAGGEYVWALKDIAFEVKKGEVLGIIGRNGAGKSTLLKLLSRIMAPTCGTIKARGRIASLLEVGTGFHPELTGRENIYLNGAILGMRREEVRRQLDAMIEFSGCGKYIDTPVKRYSSGMTVRLGFAVAAHLECEILVVDEVLAVGDAEFQRKCIDKMGEVARNGRTVLFVSHNMSAVKALCNRAILLSEGMVSLDGQVDAVVGQYLGGSEVSAHFRVWDDPLTAPGDKQTWLKTLTLEADPFDEYLGITTNSKIRISAEYWNDVPDAMMNLSLVLYTLDDICVLNTWSEAMSTPRGWVRSVCNIPENFLNDERYRIRLLIVRDATTPIMDSDNLLSFEVRDATRNGNWYGKVVGAVRPRFEWETAPLIPVVD